MGAPDAVPWAAPAEAGATDDGLTEDERFARQLQEEEAREWQARMLALAGVVPLPPGVEDAMELQGDEGDEEGGVDVDAMSYEELLALGDAAGHVNRGVSADVVKQLPRRQWMGGSATASATCLCLVCRQDYEVGDALLDLPCGHAFHEECITPWLTDVNKICPCCKAELTPRKLAQMQTRSSRGQLHGHEL